MHHQIAHRSHWQIKLKWRPVIAIVIRNVNALLRARIKHPADFRIIAHAIQKTSIRESRSKPFATFFQNLSSDINTAANHPAGDGRPPHKPRRPRNATPRCASPCSTASLPAASRLSTFSLRRASVVPARHPCPPKSRPRASARAQSYKSRRAVLRSVRRPPSPHLDSAALLHRPASDRC